MVATAMILLATQFKVLWKSAFHRTYSIDTLDCGDMLFLSIHEPSY